MIKCKSSHIRPPAWHLVGMALILFLVVGIFTGRNIQQTQESITRLLVERGNSLIEIFESSLRSGFRTRSGLEVQSVLEELSNRDDIVFVALTTSSGTILAHSDASRVGQQITLDFKPLSIKRITELREHGKDNWGVMNMEGKHVFVVYRILFPKVEGASVSPTNPIMAFVGQEPGPLQVMTEQSLKNALFSGLLILLTGLTALLALHYFERGLESRRRMQAAENLAQSMVGEVRRLEEEMRRREKLAAVGDLAAGVAHELRNPLSSIKGYATYFGQRFPEGSEDREAALLMVQETERLNRVITDLIGVSRPTDIHPVPTDLTRLSEDILRLLAADVGQRGVTLHMEGTAPPVMMDPDRFRQALLNVCLNAVEAMKNGGNLTLRLSAAKDHVHMDVIDSGPGIPEEYISRIFDPYFTTKSQGTGLGLATTLKIVEAHGGTITVSSSNQGATVRVTLPLNRQTDIQDVTQ